MPNLTSEFLTGDALAAGVIVGLLLIGAVLGFVRAAV